ncbi:MAG: nitrate reductase cytochrome c-type subunit [Holophagaceae bacterium]
MSRLILSLTLCILPLAASKPPAKPIPDRNLGLSRTSVFEVPAPPAYREEASEPGEKALPRRINREFPPVIPHSVADSLPITRSSNLCLDCHAVSGPKKRGEATPIPPSHYLDLRRAPEAKGTQVAGTRYVCISCHVPRTDAPPLVGSSYRP